MERGTRGRSRGRARGRGRGRARGRGKKVASRISSDEEVSQEQIEETIVTEEITTTTIDLSAAEIPAEVVLPVEEAASNKENEDNTIVESPIIPQTIDMEADISQLEAPTFTTISRGPPEPMLRLKWDHKVNLIGEKVLNPMIHCCDQCDKPILVYGRMIPCKHVFCLKCARQEPIKNCPRCKDKVLRVEQSGLGTVFMCTHGGSRYGSKGCKRTYLSQRDLQAHINHRHVTPQQQPAPVAVVKPSPQVIDTKAMSITPRKIDISEPPSSTASTPMQATRSLQRASGSHQFVTTSSSSSSPASSSSRVNLISVPVQEAQQALGKVNIQQHSSGSAPSNLGHHSPASNVEQVASASYYSNALLSYSGPNRPHIHSTHSNPHGHVNTSHTVLAQNYHGGIPSIGGSHNVVGSVPGPPTVVPLPAAAHGLPLVPPPAHINSQPVINASVVPPPPAPPQAPAYYAPYGQQYGQLPPPPPPSHYQFDQSAAGYPPNPQWNQQQYYR